MKRRDVAAIVVAAAVVGAAGMTDWSPKAIVARHTRETVTMVTS